MHTTGACPGHLRALTDNRTVSKNVLLLMERTDICISRRRTLVVLVLEGIPISTRRSAIPIVRAHRRCRTRASHHALYNARSRCVATRLHHGRHHARVRRRMRVRHGVRVLLALQRRSHSGLGTLCPRTGLLGLLLDLLLLLHRLELIECEVLQERGTCRVRKENAEHFVPSFREQFLRITRVSHRLAFLGVTRGLCGHYESLKRQKKRSDALESNVP